MRRSRAAARLGHHLEPVQMRRPAELEQDVQPVVGDLPRDIPFRQIGHAADRGDVAGNLPLLRLRCARVKPIGKQLEVITVMVFENRQGEVTDRMVAPVGRYATDANAWVASRPSGSGGPASCGRDRAARAAHRPRYGAPSNPAARDGLATICRTPPAYPGRRPRVDVRRIQQRRALRDGAVGCDRCSLISGPCEKIAQAPDHLRGHIRQRYASRCQHGGKAAKETHQCRDMSEHIVGNEKIGFPAIA